MIRVLVGIGTSESQRIPFEVLRHSILSRAERYAYTVEAICDWSDRGGIAPKPIKVGTSFSLQRLLVAQEAYMRGYDIFVYMDSDMLCLQSLDHFIDHVSGSTAQRLVIPSWQEGSIRCWQTAIFAGVACKEVVGWFDSLTGLFSELGSQYAALIAFKPMSHHLHFVSETFNQRDTVEKGTVVLHYTDLFRQPWISPFNSCSHLWQLELSNLCRKDSRFVALLEGGIAKGDYKPSLRLGRTKLEDLFFLPPEFKRTRIGRYLGCAPVYRLTSKIFALVIQMLGAFRYVLHALRTWGT